MKIGYLQNPNLNFISGHVISGQFAYFLGQYCEVIPILVNKKGLEEAAKDLSGFDYLCFDTNNYGLVPFFLREKGILKFPFLFYLHTVSTERKNITLMVPFLRSNDVILAPSEHAKECFQKISPAFDVKVLNHHLDLSQIKTTPKKKKNKVITFMGRLVPEKGIRVLLESLPLILGKFPDLELQIIGPLSSQGLNDQKTGYVDLLQKRCKELKIDKNVLWCGALYDEKKYEALSQSDLFINPSMTDYETFGVVNIEALACGIPVACTSLKPFLEIVEEGKTGIFFSAFWKDGRITLDVSDLTKKIIQLLSDEKALLEMKANAYLAAKKYDFRENIPRFISYLEKRLEEKPSSHELLENKTVSDFMSLYHPDWHFFIHSLGLSKKPLKLEDDQVIDHVEKNESSKEEKNDSRLEKMSRKIHYDLKTYLGSL